MPCQTSSANLCLYLYAGSWSVFILLFIEYEDGSLASWVNRERFQNYLQIDGFTLYELGETGIALYQNTRHMGLIGAYIKLDNFLMLPYKMIKILCPWNIAQAFLYIKKAF